MIIKPENTLDRLICFVSKISLYLLFMTTIRGKTITVDACSPVPALLRRPWLCKIYLQKSKSYVLCNIPKVIQKLSVRVIVDNSQNFWLDRVTSSVLQDWNSYIRFLFFQDVDKFREVWSTGWKMSLKVLMPSFDTIICSW